MKNPRVTILTSSSEQYMSLALVTNATKQLYASKWGYRFEAKLHTDRGRMAWERVEFWLASLVTCDWLFFTGTDVMITNLSQSLDQFIHSKHDLLVCSDVNGIQGDSWVMRYSLRTVQFLRDVLSFENILSHEQDAMNAVLMGMRTYRAYEKMIRLQKKEKSLQKRLSQSPVRVKLIHPRLLNACPYEHYQRSDHPGWAWRKGDFLVHMHGKSLDYRLRHLPAYLPIR